MGTVQAFIDDFPQLSKIERENIFLDDVEQITNWYIKRAFMKGENQLLREFFELMNTKKFFKMFKEVAVNYPDYCIEFCTVVGDFLENTKKLPENYQPDEELKEKYIGVLEKLLKKKSKAIAKDTLLPIDLIINLLVVMPTERCISSEKYIGIQVGRVNRKIYNTIGALEDFDEEGKLSVKQFKVLYTSLFGSDMLPGVALSILLERKDICKNFNERQLKVYNIITEFALRTIEKCDKETVRDIVASYANRRMRDAKDGRDSARRVQLSEISEDYVKIHKAIKKVVNLKEDYAKYL